jgi:hypothetical protein
MESENENEKEGKEIPCSQVKGNFTIKFTPLSPILIHPNPVHTPTSC